MMKSGLAKIFLCLLMMFCVACQETPIVHDLQERDANEILVLLGRSGIQASKEKFEKNQEVTWIVKVKPADATNARSILVANRLPRVRHGGLSGICKDAGLIPTPKTEKCREILGYKGEIINLLENISGVVSADVVLNIPDKDEFPDAENPTPRPTASVTVQFLSGTDAANLTEGKVQQIVANSIPALDPRDVTVIMSVEILAILPQVSSALPGAGGVTPVVVSPVAILATPALEQGTNQDITTDQKGPELASIGGLKMDAKSAQKFKIIAVVFLVLFLLLTVSFIAVLLKLSRAKKQSAEALVAGDGDDSAEGDPKLLRA